MPDGSKKRFLLLPQPTSGVRPVARCLKKTMHTNYELWQTALQDPILSPIMQGIYPSDKLPVINTFPSGLIANTDPHHQPKTHWIAMYFASPREANFLTATDIPLKTYDMDGYIYRPRCYLLQRQTVA